MKLFALSPGKSGRISSVSRDIPKKLVALGFVPGSEVTLIRRSFFGKLTLVELRRRKYAIRDEDAIKIEIG